MIYISLGFFIIGLVIFLISLNKSKNDQFYSDTLFLALFGVFVWGDGLILGPFWMLSGLFFLKLSFINIIEYYLIFYSLRSGYEVIYWINHQVSQKNYEPPFFRKISWIKSNEAAILYQLLNLCQVAISLSLLFYLTNK